MFRGLDLIKVVAAPKGDAGDVRVQTVEMYTDGVIVRYVLPRSRSTEPVFLELSDDVGTDYTQDFGGGSSGGGRPHRGYAAFTPAVPAAARRLTITSDDGAAVVELSA